jgi:hypothetical protein
MDDLVIPGATVIDGIGCTSHIEHFMDTED